MKKTGAWLARYALEQLGVRYTFGIPGVHNTELYDELNSSETIQPVLVTHEAGAAFMADAISRTSDSIGTLVIVPAAGAAYASAGIGEAYLDGIPMLVISGGIRTDVPYTYQLHEMDQQNFLAEITKQTWKVDSHAEIIPTLYEAFRVANEGEPGPVFVEIPVNLQLFSGEVEHLPVYQPDYSPSQLVESAAIEKAVNLLSRAKRPGIFVGWGARNGLSWVREIAEFLNAPVCTTLQGLSAFPANHPLHTGMGFGNYAVPAAANAFKDCDCMLAVGTRFGEIATGSFGVKPPQNLIHIDINPMVFDANFPAQVAIEGDAAYVLEKVWDVLQRQPEPVNLRSGIREQIQKDKHEYAAAWLQHDSQDRVNPFHFFRGLRNTLEDEDVLVVDDGNHTFLAAELMPIHRPGCFISPTDFNCMGYAVPAAIGVKLANPDKHVAAVVGDGAFTMTCMEILTAASQNLGIVFFVFHDGELSQISQAQEIPYNRKTCTVLGNLDVAGVAKATGARFLALERNVDVDQVMSKAWSLADDNVPVIVDVKIDYSKRTRFTEGIVVTNLKRFNLGTKARFIGRALVRKVTG
ncbi:MAG: acetolactate synthase large subunit [Pseudomonadales bacterium]|nr:acetolactate synthase large subunit [Pseudomonadales bacterium]MBI26556.1 acetolactate synthase large subunit [Pseudomonadales bacterium]TNC84601.1 MAG: acetolactate synthase large subunit [Alcanivorax sp.]HAG93393.1 acetolactate synthase large subunit [Gammaproteobacteria bacterium]HBO92955.1 acetolactate synthase large subunit [Gammaproteobacteria bacterium]|tara:strand:- start:10848 stop:12584 length:1737 start_codon:yes stop_codon:yes gene_type:complete